MKTILTALNARYSHSSLALRYLQKYCNEFDIELAEFTINDNMHSVYARLIEKEADVYCFSCYIWNITQTTLIAQMIKTALPNCKIVFGGPQCEGDFEFVDYFITGEGEQALFELLSAIEQNTQMPKTISCKPLPDLSKIPQPYNRTDIEALKGKIIYFETSRGCPFSCSYCLSSIQKGVRFFPMNYVKKGLSMLFEERVPIIKLVDRTFNCNKERAAEIIEFITENSICSQVHLEIAPHLIDEEIIRRLSDAPKLFKLEMGIQSTNEQTLKAINRSFDLILSAENIKKLKNAGLEIHLDLIAGLPFEDYNSFSRSFDFVYSLSPDMLQLGFLKVLQGTAVKQEKSIKHMHTPPFEVLATDWLTPFELCRLKDIENAVDRIYNSKAFARSIKKLTENKPFLTFEALAEKIKNAEKDGSIPRYALYEILYDFGGDKIIEELAFDFLQNNKDRPLPSFLPKTSHENFKQFCHKYLKENNLSQKDVRFEGIFGKTILADYKNDSIKYIGD